MVKLDQHYVDPRLVALYDRENTARADIDFYLRLAADLDARHILDLGGGTGVLAGALAGADRQVVGVDPAPAMLAGARRQLGAARVQWVAGTAAGCPVEQVYGDWDRGPVTGTSRVLVFIAQRL